MFGKLKKGMGDLKADADIQTEYLMAKNKNNFDHPGETGARIKSYNDSYQAADELRQRVSSWVEKYQELINSELKMVERMNSSAVPAIAPVYSTFTTAETSLTTLRQQHLGKVIEYISAPAKKYITDQIPVRDKVDKTNKAWIELRYWRKKGGSHVQEEKDAQASYESHTEQLMGMLADSIDNQLAQWVKYFADFQIEFFQHAANIAPRI
eukprot:TRINITY_DN528_c0_g1_i1.p1 TRINITY_DN528_c0_g1~~TRINITY_DN528_c0_g1_i1.p1  ORF type:complete len:210 (+),score=58.99 TRINITY_DN528_c0_g1_i1:78-707(+)